jgi:hypothetical protein
LVEQRLGFLQVKRIEAWLYERVVVALPETVLKTKDLRICEFDARRDDRPRIHVVNTRHSSIFSNTPACHLMTRAPYTYVTTKEFLSHFSFDTLRDLPDMNELKEAGLLSKQKLLAGAMPGDLGDSLDLQDDGGEGDLARDEQPFLSEDLEIRRRAVLSTRSGAIGGNRRVRVRFIEPVRYCIVGGDQTANGDWVIDIIVDHQPRVRRPHLREVVEGPLGRILGFQIVERRDETLTQPGNRCITVSIC